MKKYSLSPTSEKVEWDERPFNPYYIDRTDWYSEKVMNNRVTAVYINGNRHDRLTWVSDY